MSDETKDQRLARLQVVLEAQFTQGNFRRSGGVLAMHKAHPWGRTELPVVVFLHGALRASEELIEWAAILSEVADVLLVDMPGHRRSSMVDPPSVDKMADVIHEALRAGLAGRRALLIGESLGGLVALRIAGDSGPTPFRAVIAIDPPMTTSKQWTIEMTFKRLMEGGGATPLAKFAKEAFGIVEGGHQERVYYPLLSRVHLPLVIATGDVPLMPPRVTTANEHPCVFDPVDRHVIETHYTGRADIRTFEGAGHLLLKDAIEPLRQLIVSMLDQHVSAPVGVRG